MAKTTFKFGLGNRSVFSAKEILDAIKADVSYFEAAGNGLVIAGVNIHDLDHTIRFSEGTASIIVTAPELEPIEIPCSFTGQEDDQSVEDEPAK